MTTTYCRRFPYVATATLFLLCSTSVAASDRASTVIADENRNPAPSTGS